LATFAVTQPYASCSVFTHGFSSKWTFFLHTTPEITESFFHHFLPRLVPHPPNDVERSLFSLLAHLGGLGNFNPSEIASTTYVPVSRRHQALTDAAKSIHCQCPSDLQHIMNCLQEKGSSSWLTSLPMGQHGFVLHKGDFIDALCLRYGWTPPRLLSHCVCGSKFLTSHAFSCPHGAFLTI